MDKIKIKDLLVRGIVGINPEERQNKQDILINITLFIDRCKNYNDDNIDTVVNYETLTKNVINIIESTSYLLVERLAENIARDILETFNVNKVCLSVEKPTALRFCLSVGVEIERKIDDYK